MQYIVVLDESWLVEVTVEATSEADAVRLAMQDCGGRSEPFWPVSSIAVGVRPALE